MDNDPMEKIEEVKRDLEAHKTATEERFRAISQSIDDRLGRIAAMAKGMLPADDPGGSDPIQWDSSITATPQENYPTEQTPSAIFMAGNGYRFEPKDGNPPGTFITMARRGRTGIIRFKRDVKGQSDSFGNPINSFVPAFPAFVVGSFNGREATGFYDNPQLPGVKRQYGYPAFDLREVAKRVGLPSTLRDLKEFKIRCKLAGTFYGSSAFLDLYLHNLQAAGALEGYRGTINAIDGNFTKGVNINTWFKHPSEVNTDGIANGWTGATKIADKRISDTNVEVALKVETVNGNEFLYVAVAPESRDFIEWDVKAVTEWAEEDLEATIDRSPFAKELIAGMINKPVKMSDGVALCGGHLGSEFWYSRPGFDYDEMEFIDLEFRINGTSHYLDGMVEHESGIIAPPVQPRLPAVDDTGERNETRPLRLKVGRTKMLPQSRGGGRITANPGIVTNPTNSPGIMVRLMKPQDGVIEWTDSTGGLWSTKIVTR